MTDEFGVEPGKKEYSVKTEDSFISHVWYPTTLGVKMANKSELGEFRIKQTHLVE